MHFEDLLRPGDALFLDFDGTLVDLAAQPEAVVVPAPLLALLSAWHHELGGALAIVSGRPISQIDAFLAPLRLPVAGEHGAERRGADGTVTLLPTESLDIVQQAALALAAGHPGLRVELKRGSIALHYRQAPDLADLCLETMQAAVDRSPGLGLLRGKMVMEAKSTDVSKGQAITAFLDEAPFAGRRPLFVGDDITDEPGFSAVQNRGGHGVKVGAGPSLARHRLDSPAALHAVLARTLNQTITRSPA